MIADPGNPSHPQPLPGNEPEKIIYTDVASEDGTVTTIAFMQKPNSASQLEEPQPQRISDEVEFSIIPGNVPEKKDGTESEDESSTKNPKRQRRMHRKKSS